MSDPLYAPPLLRLAADAAGAGRLSPADAEGHAHNPTCGDRVDVTLRLNADGSIQALAHDSHACVLAQASASILGTRALGKTAGDLQTLREAIAVMLKGGPAPGAPFADYAALAPAAAHRNRHACVLLPLDAVLNALATKT
jgi:NifU-like protein involved in Fe-S cluster formation